jgi:FkbM family methyltransferase
VSGSVRSPRKVARRLKVLPLTTKRIKNWPAFTVNYALGLTPRSPYVFRNGARLRLVNPIDHAPVVEIFLRDEYGEIPDGAVVLDLGASIGTFSVYAATAAHGVSVYAYEPFPESYDLMRTNVSLNGRHADVRCFNLAVAGEEGPRKLFLTGTDYYYPTLSAAPATAASQAIEVECTTLPRILETNSLEQVDLLKLDCEGAEYEILFSTPLPYFERIAEIRMEHHGASAEEDRFQRLLQFLVEAGYRVVHTAWTSPNAGVLWARRVERREGGDSARD